MQLIANLIPCSRTVNGLNQRAGSVRFKASSRPPLLSEISGPGQVRSREKLLVQIPHVSICQENGQAAIPAMSAALRVETRLFFSEARCASRTR